MTARVWIAAATSVATIAISFGAVASPASAVDTCLDQFEPTSGSYVGGTTGTYTCVVPAGVAAYNIEVRGGYGAKRSSVIGAVGAKLTGKITVASGSTLAITVGGNGQVTTGNAYGASGGGYSARPRSWLPVAVAVAATDQGQAETVAPGARALRGTASAGTVRLMTNTHKVAQARPTALAAWEDPRTTTSAPAAQAETLERWDYPRPVVSRTVAVAVVADSARPEEPSTAAVSKCCLVGLAVAVPRASAAAVAADSAAAVAVAE